MMLGTRPGDIEAVVALFLRPIVRYAPWIAIAAVVVLVAVVALTREARAHPGYQWIEANRAFVDRDSIHCCGTDCEPLPASEFIEERDGIRWKGGAKLYYGKPDGRHGGIYWSQEPNPPLGQRYWMCSRGGQVKCIFRPQPGS